MTGLHILTLAIRLDSAICRRSWRRTVAAIGPHGENIVPRSIDWNDFNRKESLEAIRLRNRWFKTMYRKVLWDFQNGREVHFHM